MNRIVDETIKIGYGNGKRPFQFIRFASLSFVRTYTYKETETMRKRIKDETGSMLTGSAKMILEAIG